MNTTTVEISEEDTKRMFHFQEYLRKFITTYVQGAGQKADLALTDVAAVMSTELALVSHAVGLSKSQYMQIVEFSFDRIKGDIDEAMRSRVLQ